MLNNNIKKKSTLLEFLNGKALYYDKIEQDKCLDVWNYISTLFELPTVIHIVGTNGKGTTGRFLAQYLYNLDYSVLHYSSPHIMEFNERVWINGKNACYDVLDKSHNNLLNILGDMASELTYFEYTTILAIFISKDVEYLVLEAGLGGEYDATNIIKSKISLITPIDFDHQSFLGDTIEEIASTKLKSINNIAFITQQQYQEVYLKAFELNKLFYHTKDVLNKNELSLIQKYINQNNFASYLKQNLALAICCIKYLKLPINMKYLKNIELFGRCQKIANNITIDVGHNPLAAQVLFNEFANKKVNLIFNSMQDKEYHKVLKVLQPIIKKIFIIEIDNKRIEKIDKIIETVKHLNMEYSIFDNMIDNQEEYLIFGSFMVVEEFLSRFSSQKITYLSKTS